MTTYKLPSNLPIGGERFSALLAALERGFEKFGIDFYLVGAVSRDVWMTGIHQIKPQRTTGDIDFAVFINDEGVYEQLKEYLIGQEGFTADRQNAFVLIYSDGTEVDLLPFGAIEDEDRRVTVQGTGYRSIHVDGFREVYNAYLPQAEIEGHTLKFCPLPGLVLLKLIAWEDRPEVRQDDITDICSILDKYFEMYSEEIYQNHADIFVDESDKDPSLTEIAARVLGRELKSLVEHSEKLRDRLSNLIDQNTQDAETSRMGEIMVGYFHNTIEANIRLLQYLRKGFTE